MVSNNVHRVAGRSRGRKAPILEVTATVASAASERVREGAAAELASVAAATGLPDVVGATDDVGRSKVGRGKVGRSRAAGGVVKNPYADESTEVLLARYRCRPGSLRTRLALRDELVERHRPIVEAMAHSLASRLPPSVDAQDLVHAGVWGLMQAIDSYLPERCDAFTAFMRIRVRGSMLDELRHMDFLPRLYRRRLRERESAVARLRMTLEREPTASELASELGITEAALMRRFEPSLLRADRGVDRGEELDEVEMLADTAEESPIEAINRQDLLNLVRANLEPVEWKVLQLHYLEGMTGKQVARRLRLSAARICQIHGRVLDRLKAQLAASDPS